MGTENCVSPASSWRCVDLGADGRPVYVCPGGDCDQNPGHLFQSGSRPNFNGAAPFAEWWDSTSENNIEVVGALPLDRNEALGTYVFNSTGSFYPLDASGWVAAGEEDLANGGCPHNVSFSSETHFWFEYQGGEQFEFSGDDDLWVFVNGKLVLDLGGLHVSQTASFELDADTDGAGPDLADGTADVDGHHADFFRLRSGHDRRRRLRNRDVPRRAQRVRLELQGDLEGL